MATKVFVFLMRFLCFTSFLYLLRWDKALEILSTNSRAMVHCLLLFLISYLPLFQRFDLPLKRVDVPRWVFVNVKQTLRKFQKNQCHHNEILTGKWGSLLLLESFLVRLQEILERRKGCFIFCCQWIDEVKL